MRNVELRSFPDAAALAAAAARGWLGELAAGRGGDRPFCVALSGGRIARPFYEAIVAASQGKEKAWRDVEFFFADERWVPLDDPESNYRLAREGLFGPLGIPARRLHPFQVGADPEFAAAQAQAELLHRTAVTVQGDPILDLVILGLGEDGHVASLFPDAPAAVVNSRAVYLPVIGPKPPPQRITLSYAVLAAARRVWVLVSGAGKEPALRASLLPTGQTPLATVIRSRRTTTIFTDVTVLADGTHSSRDVARPTAC